MDYTDCEMGAYYQETANQEVYLKPTPPSEKPAMETGDWRTQLQSNVRQRIVNKILDTLKRHIPFHGEEGLNELRKIALRFEEKIYSAASSQSDYLRRISWKMLTMEAKPQNTAQNSAKSSKLPDPGSQSMQSQLHSQGLSLPIPLPDYHFKGGQQLFHQNIPNDMASTAAESCAGLQSASPSISGLTQIPIPNAVYKNPSKKNISDIPQISIGNLIGQDGPSNVFPNSSGQIQGQQEVFSKQQQQLLYQEQSLRQQLLQQALLKETSQQQMPQASSLLLQPQHLIEQLYLSQQTPEISSNTVEQTGQAIGDDWQEEVYQKIKALKEKYFTELNEMHQEIVAKLQRYDLLQQPKTQQLDKLKIFKTMLERIIVFLSVSKRHILPSFKEKLVLYEKQIINFISINRPRKPVSILQKGQLSSPNVFSIQQTLSQIDLSQSDDNQMNPQLQLGFEPTPITTQLLMQQRQQQQTQLLLNPMQEHQRMQQQYLHQLAKQQLSAKMKTHELLQPHQMDDTDDVNLRQGIDVNPGVLQENLPTGQPGYSHEQSKPGVQFLTSSPLLAAIVPSTSTLLTPSAILENFEKPIYSASSQSNISHHQATGEQAGSECPAADTLGNGMSTPPLLAGFKNANGSHGNDLTTDFGKSNIVKQPHDPRVTMAKPMSPKSLSASFVTMVDEAATAVGEDLAAMRKHGLHARNFFAQTGMTGAEKMRCCMSAIIILALMFWFIFILHHQY